MSQPISVLDAHQLQRIEAVHRGYLYQHLYAAGCLLLAGSAGTVAVAVELDEDIEIRLANRRIYAQVKTRQASLTLSDIEGALDRFKAIRKAHASGERAGDAVFCIVSNVAPGPRLAAQLSDAAWPSDVTVRWPGHDGADETALPPAWAGAAEAVAWCAKLAEALPFRSLAPETLVWKLSGRILLAASGDASKQPSHTFLCAELPDLFEQLVVQLQEFPIGPLRYRPQVDEPALSSERRVRLIVGFSGAGKTSWAAQAAMLLPGQAIYFDGGDLPGPAIATSLARELAAHIFGATSGGLGEILLPGASGLEMLRALDLKLKRDGLEPVVVLDNAHKSPATDLRALLEVTARMKFVLLGHPGPVAHELQNMLGLAPETLGGWEPDTIAAEAADNGCSADYATCMRLLALTGGLPLFVQSALRGTVRQYDGDIAAFCNDVEAQTHLTETAQEVILSSAFASLELPVQDTLSVLAVSDVPLSRAEAEMMSQRVLSASASDTARALRSLEAAGMVQIFGDRRIKVHDAVRVIAKSHLEKLGPDVIRPTCVSLKEILADSLRQERDLSRFPLFVRMLSAIGDAKTLADLAGDEFFHELGLSRDLWKALEDAAASEDTDSEQRFWALDALVFADFKEGIDSTVPERLELMGRLIANAGLGPQEQLAFSMKQMLWSSGHGDIHGTKAAYANGLRLLPEDPSNQRIFRYNSAYAMYRLGAYTDALRVAEELFQEYYGVLGIGPEDVLLKKQVEIWKRLKPSDHLRDDLKHLADSLDLFARCNDKLGKSSGLARIHALKFYSLAHAIDSLLKVGQDVVDEFVQRRDYIGARETFEQHLLPIVREYKLAGRVVPLRSQYAVVLAFCGEHAAAATEMTRITPYENGLSEGGRKELRRQRQLIEELSSARTLQPAFREKIGRNERCPCGSGLKYKKCHGQ